MTLNHSWKNQGRWTVLKKEGGKASGWAPEITPKHRKSLPHGRQQGSAKGAAPRGRRFAPPPWGSCCLPFGKDFLCFGLISGAHPEAFPHLFGTVHLPWFSQCHVDRYDLICYGCLFVSHLVVVHVSALPINRLELKANV